MGPRVLLAVLTWREGRPCKQGEAIVGVRLTLLVSMQKPVHEEVMELVCCPAKSVAIRKPEISSSVVARPPYDDRYLESMNTCAFYALGLSSYIHKKIAA